MFARLPAVSRRDLNKTLLAGFVAMFHRKAAAQGLVAPMVHLADIAIAGGFYYALKAALEQLTPGTRLHLTREPDNAFDANAIVIHDNAGRKLGYVPRRANPPLARLMDENGTVVAEVVGTLARNAEVPAGLVHTGFIPGDPIVRLTTAQV